MNMSYDEDEELKELLEKRRKALEAAARGQNLEAKKEQERIALEREYILRSILTEEARERLVRLKLARPKFATMIEDQLILLARSGRLAEQITDEQLKEILRRFLKSRRNKSGNIIIKRKGGI
ncbi:MAG: DNA-binding protein [Candidatus Njordarchaeum guaymaensis]|nr:DNA-binding protein [Candidatus Korarchaeota archaeon]